MEHPQLSPFQPQLRRHKCTICNPHLVSLLGGSWDLVSEVISTLIAVISIVTLIINLVTKSHDPLSSPNPEGPYTLLLWN